MFWIDYFKKVIIGQKDTKGILYTCYSVSGFSINYAVRRKILRASQASYTNRHNGTKKKVLLCNASIYFNQELSTSPCKLNKS